MIERDWLPIEPEPWRDREELEAENARLRAEHDVLLAQLAARDRLTVSLCNWANRLEARVAELSRGRRTVVDDHTVLLAELPLLPSARLKQAAADRHGITPRQVNRLLRERGGPERGRLKLPCWTFKRSC